MAVNWQNYQEKFDQQPVRMRLLFFAAAAMVFILLTDLLWLTPGQNAIKKDKQQLQQLDGKMAQLNASLQQQNAMVYTSQHSGEQLEIESLDKQISTLKESLQESTVDLVSASEMIGLLKSIIQGFDQLRLLKLQKHEAVAVAVEDQTNSQIAAQAPVKAEQQIQLYRHTLEIQFEGDFNSTSRFLKVLEELPRKVQFDRFDYKVTRYPKAEVTLEVSTLSFNKEWIGG